MHIMNTSGKQTADFSGRVAIVTGAASGIGLAISESLACAGAQVVLLDRQAEVAHIAAGLIGGNDRHMSCVLDVTSREDIDKAVDQVLSRYGRIDVLVNNAGIVLLDDADSLSAAAWEKTMAINLTAPFFLAQAVAPTMRRQRYGRIVNLASQAAVIALDRHAAYCASKAGLVGLTKVLALEWAREGITVNAVSPTVVETALGKQAWAGEVGRVMQEKIPVGRFAQPEEVAGLVAYLASEQAAMITGENILIDGGYCAQ